MESQENNEAWSEGNWKKKLTRNKTERRQTATVRI